MLEKQGYVEFAWVYGRHHLKPIIVACSTFDFEQITKFLTTYIQAKLDYKK